jgi:hypothetical protein
VHAVIATPFVVAFEWDILKLSRLLINDMAKACADTFQLPLAKSSEVTQVKNNSRDKTASAQGP